MNGQVEHASKRIPGQVRRWFTLNAVLLGVVGLISLTYPVEELGRRLGDVYFRLRGSQPTSDSVTLVLIDDASLSRYGRWPWPRSLLARLLRAVSGQRAQVIGLDILLSEPGIPEEDQELANALQEAGNVVLASKISSATQERLWVDPLPLFAARAAGVGHVQAVAGPDGICRSVPVRELSADGPRWAFALEVSRAAKGVTLKEDRDGLWLGTERIQVEGQRPRTETADWESFSAEFMMVDFRSQLEPGQSMPPFVVVSAGELLDGRAEPRLQGKAVLIGFGATELSDRLATPVSDQTPMPGVEIHANVVDAVLGKHSLRRVDAAAQVLLLIGFSLGSTWLVLQWSGAAGLLALVFLVMASYGAGFWLFVHLHRLLDFGPLLCGGVLAAPLAQLQNLLVINRGLTRGLRELRETLRSSQPRADRTFASLGPAVPETGDLHWKLELINQLQAELASLYTFRQGLLESMQEGLAVFSADGKLLFRNPCWQQFCEKQHWNPDLNLREFANSLGHPNWSNVSEGLKEAGFRLESEIHLGNGLWQVQAMRLPLGSTGEARLMIVVTDLTSRLERDRAREEALGFVTHELRTPLVSIQGFAEFLLRYPQAEGSKDAATTIFRESRRLVALINTYLDVLRLDAGSRPVRRELVDIAEMVTQVYTLLKPLSEAAGSRVNLKMDAGLPSLRGDPHLLAGVLLNLLNNALKYSPVRSEILLAVRAESPNVVFEVWNPGPPIPPEEVQHLFDRFYRGPSKEASSRGWGLGLAFVKRIAEEHGGQIEVSSDTSGTWLRVVLPGEFPAATALPTSTEVA